MPARIALTARVLVSKDVHPGEGVVGGKKQQVKQIVNEEMDDPDKRGKRWQIAVDDEEQPVTRLLEKDKNPQREFGWLARAHTRDGDMVTAILKTNLFAPAVLLESARACAVGPTPDEPR